MMRQLCYLSTAARELDDAALERILASAHANNSRSGVTGLLVYGRGVFFQVLEGPRDCVEATLQRIKRNPQHYGMTILSDEEVAARDFEGWHMAFAPLDPETAERIGQGAFVAADLVPVVVSALGNPLLSTFAKRVAEAA